LLSRIFLHKFKYIVPTTALRAEGLLTVQFSSKIYVAFSAATDAGIDDAALSQPWLVRGGEVLDCTTPGLVKPNMDEEHQ
jgi:hypothetical protein